MKKLDNDNWLNLSLLHETAYDKIEKEIIKFTVNRNIGDFGMHENNYITKDVIKGIEEIFECKPVEKI